MYLTPRLAPTGVTNTRFHASPREEAEVCPCSPGLAAGAAMQ